MFNRAIRHLMGVPPLARTEERVALLRTADAMAGADPALAARVRHDVAAWQEALAKAARADPPVPLSAPPRLPLLTPVGRFVPTLYEVWADGRFDLSADAFLSLLNSGWLGADAQDAAAPLDALTAQFFARCRARADWEAAFARVREVRAALSRRGESRLPAGGLPERVLGEWDRTLGRVQELCERLFAAPRQSIGEHVRWLLDALDRLSPGELFRRERAVVECVREALAAAADSGSMPVTAREFGEVLTALAREYERAADEPDAPADWVWVATPEGIDNSPRDVVFFLGADDQRVPRPVPPAWPFDRADPAAHAEQERYLFLAVVRAAGLRLHLSFARFEHDREYRPSPYLEEAARVRGRAGESVVSPAPASLQVPPGEPPEVAARRREYDLADIAHFALCPFRYKLERLDRRARHYRDPLQVPKLAVVAEVALGHLRDDGRTSAWGTDGRLALLASGLDAVRDRVRQWFPGLREGDWATVEAYAREELQAQAAYKASYSLRVIDGRGGRYTITDGVG